MPSSVIASYSYNGQTQSLRVVFLSGMIYDYLNVPLGVYNKMRKALSKGAFLNKEIKGRFPYKKLH